MKVQADGHVRRFSRCIQFKVKPERPPLSQISITYPMELVHVDHLTIQDTEGGKYVKVLVITDHFTHYAQAIVNSDNLSDSKVHSTEPPS